MRLSSAENPRIKAVVRLREHKERRRTGLFVAEGVRSVERAASSGLRWVECYVGRSLAQSPAWPDWRARVSKLADASGAKEPAWIEVTDDLLARMAYQENPEGVLGVFESPRWVLDDLARAELLLVAVGTGKPGNLGAMARTAAAAGFGGMVACDGVIDAMNPNAIHASTGAVFALPVVASDRAGLLTWMRVRGFALWPAMVAQGRAHTDIDFSRGRHAVVIGPEDSGLDDWWLEAARASGGSALRIDMHTGIVDSLNASVAAGVILFEAARQRRSQAKK